MFGSLPLQLHNSDLNATKIHCERWSPSCRLPTDTFANEMGANKTRVQTRDCVRVTSDSRKVGRGCFDTSSLREEGRGGGVLERVTID